MKVYIVEVNQHRNLNQIRDDFSSLSLIESVFPIRKVFIDFSREILYGRSTISEVHFNVIEIKDEDGKICELWHVRKRLKRADTSRAVRDLRSNPSKKNTSQSYLMAGS